MVRAVLGVAQHFSPMAQVRTKPGSGEASTTLGMSHLNASNVARGRPLLCGL